MAHQTSQERTKPLAPAAPPSSGAWGWLRNPANQKTLRFIGGGIVAAVGILATIGILHKPDGPTSTKTMPISSASQTAPGPAQSAVANGGGNATNIQGNGNQVGTGKP
jgi:hypothetical protein